MSCCGGVRAALSECIPGEGTCVYYLHYHHKLFRSIEAVGVDRIL
jgi:hypothetical protein